MRELADYDYNYYDVERAFLEALAEAGIPPASGEQIILDGTKRTYTVAGDKQKKRGGYVVYMDESPAGAFWKYGGSSAVPKTKWHYKTGYVSSLSEEERQALFEKQRLKRQEEERKRAQTRGMQQRKVRMEWAAATKATAAHRYAVKKKLSSVPGARLYGDSLMVAYIDTSGEIRSRQLIDLKGPSNPRGKDNSWGTGKQGHFCVLSGYPNPLGNGTDVIPPNAPGPIFICEGWATGVSIYEATECVTVVAIDAGNLYPVTKSLLENYTGAEFVVAADNDSWKNKGNTGMKAAIELWYELGVPFVAPDFEEGEELSDWNDFAAKHGLAVTKRAMLRKLELFKKQESYIEQEEKPRFLHLNYNTGRPTGTIANLEALLKAKKIWVGYNEIKKEEVMTIPGRIYCRDNAATAGVAHIKSLCAQYGYPKSEVGEYLTEIASRHVVNPVRDYILSEPWDGMNRLQTVYDSIHAEEGFPNGFKETLIRRWLLSGVAAAFSKGSGDFRCRGVLVFQGGQGIGKSTWFRTITGNNEWFGDGQSVNPSHKDDVMPAIRCWIVELGELEGTMRKADISKLKTFIAAASDDIRVPYGRQVSAFSRRTIFCGSVNQREFLMDITGNSRFWCIPAERIDRLEPKDVQQIWAQVYEEYYLSYLKDKENTDYQWWLTKEEEEVLRLQNGEFEASDPVRSAIVSQLNWDTALECTYEWKTSTEVLIMCGYPRQSITRTMAMQAGEILTRVTGQKAKRKGKSGDRKYLVPPPLTNAASLHHYY